MTPEKISKLRELADRGVGGEKDNARSILTKHGIPWSKPKESFVDSVKIKININVKKEYIFDLSKATDPLLMQIIVRTILKDNRTLTLKNSNLVINLTPGEAKIIYGIYTQANRMSFMESMHEYAMTKVNLNFKI